MSYLILGICFVLIGTCTWGAGDFIEYAPEPAPMPQWLRVFIGVYQTAFGILMFGGILAYWNLP